MNADEYADKVLQRLERRLRRLYTDNKREIQKIIDKYEYGWSENIDGEEIWHKGMFERYLDQLEAMNKGWYDPPLDVVDPYFERAWWYKKWQKGELTREEMFEHWWLAQNGRKEYWESLRDEMAARITDANKVARDYINGSMKPVYRKASDEVVSLAEKAAIEQGIAGVRFNMIDDRTLNAVINSDVFPKTKIDIPKDLLWNQTKLENAFMSGILMGDNIEQIASRFQAVENMNRTAAIRCARTAMTTAKGRARQDQYESLASKGCKATKVWRDVHDAVPPERIQHWEASGQEVPYDEPFIVGGEMLMYPGDLSMGASGWNVYNCRCRCGAGSFKFESILPKDKRGKIKVKVS